MGNYGCQPFFSQWREILVDWLLEKWNCNDLYIHEFLNIYEKHRQIIYMKSWWSIPTGWWLTYPSEKYESQIGWSSQLLGKIKNSMVPLLIIISHINPIKNTMKSHHKKPWFQITRDDQRAIDRAFQQAHQETTNVQDHCSQGAFLSRRIWVKTPVANGLPSGNLT